MNKFELEKYSTGTFLSPDLARIASSYGKMDARRHPAAEKDAQAPNSHYKYGDPFMETLLLYLIPKMEELTGLELIPTYSYYRIYYPGDDLKIHLDRPSCEISATICCGYHYENMPENYNWPIWVKSHLDTDIPIELKPGDGVVYRGCEVQHWRDMFIAPSGSWQQQVFLHYVDKNGPYTDKEYDGRPGIGYDTKKKWKIKEEEDAIPYDKPKHR